jgi:hypothetical protein
LRRITYVDPESKQRFVFLTNNFTLPALTISASAGASLYFMAGAAGFAAAGLDSVAGFFDSAANAQGSATAAHRQTIIMITVSLFIVVPPFVILLVGLCLLSVFSVPIAKSAYCL